MDYFRLARDMASLDAEGITGRAAAYREETMDRFPGTSLRADARESAAEAARDPFDATYQAAGDAIRIAAEALAARLANIAAASDADGVFGRADLAEHIAAYISEALEEASCTLARDALRNSRRGPTIGTANATLGILSAALARSREG